MQAFSAQMQNGTSVTLVSGLMCTPRLQPDHLELTQTSLQEIDIESQVNIEQNM